MKKVTIATALMALTFAAQADQFKTVKEDASLGFENYGATISYPLFFSNSIPAYKTINKDLKESLLMNGCVSQGDTQADINDIAPHGMSYEASARVVGLNRRYVGIEVRASDYCGGAHPNHYSSHYTFNSKTGEMINMDQEIIGAKYDHAENEALLESLSKAVYKQIKAEGRLNDGCFEDLNEEETIEAIKNDYPAITGLARFKKVIISTSPAHASHPCKEIVRVPYSAVKKHIEPGSILHKFLR